MKSGAADHTPTTGVTRNQNLSRSNPTPHMPPPTLRWLAESQRTQVALHRPHPNPLLTPPGQPLHSPQHPLPTTCLLTAPRASGFLRLLPSRSGRGGASSAAARAIARPCAVTLRDVAVAGPLVTLGLSVTKWLSLRRIPLWQRRPSLSPP